MKNFLKRLTGYVFCIPYFVLAVVLFYVFLFAAIIQHLVTGTWNDKMFSLAPDKMLKWYHGVFWKNYPF